MFTNTNTLYCRWFLIVFFSSFPRAIADFIRRLKDINIVLIKEDDCNLNLLHIATAIDSVFRDDVVNLIVKSAGLDINKPSGPGNDCYTACHIAADCGYSTTLQCLLHHGADPYLLDIHCNTAWDVAASKKHTNCILVLENAVNSPPSPAIDDSIYFSMSSLGLVNFDETVKLSDQSSVVQVTSQELQLRKKVNDCHSKNIANRTNKIDNSKFPDKAPAFKSTKLPPKKSTVDASISLQKNKSDDTIIYTDSDYNVTLVEVADSTLDSTIVSPLDMNLNKLTNQEIRQQLQRFGESPGPVNSTTRNLYLRKLERIKSTIKPTNYLRNQVTPVKSPAKKSQSPSSFTKSINDIIMHTFDHNRIKDLDKKFTNIFADAKGPRDFFNYLLLDPRKTRNLSEDAQEATALQDKKTQLSLFAKFIKAIFYIGKGKNNRPYMHLYEAALPGNKKRDISEKVKRIKEIWDQDYGVISFHFQHGLSDKEAFAREAFMIDAIGVNNLTNQRKGQDNKDLCGHLTKEDKEALGAFCLWKAFHLFAISGERQIKRGNIH